MATDPGGAAADAAVRASFDASGGTYGSPRVHADLVAAGWRISVNTVPCRWPGNTWWPG
jgi:putative transposase